MSPNTRKRILRPRNCNIEHAWRPVDEPAIRMLRISRRENDNVSVRPLQRMHRAHGHSATAVNLNASLPARIVNCTKPVPRTGVTTPTISSNRSEYLPSNSSRCAASQVAIVSASAVFRRLPPTDSQNPSTCK